MKIDSMSCVVASGVAERARRRPSRLLRSFAIGAAIAVVVSVALAGLGVYRIYSAHLVRTAEADAVRLAQTTLDQERTLLTAGPPGAAQLLVPPERLSAVDVQVLRHTASLAVAGLTLHDVDGRIVYSTERAAVGTSARDVVGFTSARAGGARSKLVTRVPPGGTAEIDVVESYVPLRDGDRIIGVAQISTDVTWTRREFGRVLTVSTGIVLVVLLAVLGSLFMVMRGAARQVEQAHRELETMAITDGLTGLANRRYLMARAAEECARIPRQRAKGGGKGGVGFIMTDVDSFKDVNDRHGHLAGDAVLRAVADRIRRVIRRYDLVGRYGGDEFLIVVPDSDFDETRSVAERIWQIVREEPFVQGDTRLPLSMSVGFTCADDDDVNAAIRRADEALYRAKHAGRDRVAAL